MEILLTIHLPKEQEEPLYREGVLAGDGAGSTPEQKPLLAGREPMSGRDWANSPFQNFASSCPKSLR